VKVPADRCVLPPLCGGVALVAVGTQSAMQSGGVGFTGNRSTEKPMVWWVTLQDALGVADQP